MRDAAERDRFERLMLPHLDTAFGLARCLLRDDALAEDAVQEAYLRAYRYFDGMRGGDGRPWLLKIVRNACYELLERERLPGTSEGFDEDLHVSAAAGAVVVLPVSPEAAAIARADADLVRACMAQLPHDLREAVRLRELDGCSYKEIALIVGVPIGTVMSRLARARRRLQTLIGQRVSRKQTGT